MPELNAGGVERTTLEIAEALHRQGFAPHVCSNGGRMEPSFTQFNARLYNFKIGSKNPLKLRANTKKLIDIIKAENIDIVHARSRAPAWPAHTAAKACGRPFLTTYHGIYNAKTKTKRRYNAIMAKGDLIIANSNFTRDHIVKTHGTDPKLIRVIPRGVDMNIFDPAKIEPLAIDETRKSWSIKKDQKILLLSGRLTRWKGQTVAIDALSKLPDNWVLVMMGDPQGRSKYVAELIRQANVLGVSDQIRLPGHSDNVPAALQAADIVIAPSTEPEAFGRTVTEAQAMGKPVIASAHGGPMETVIDGVTGFLTTPGRPIELAAAIEQAGSWYDYDGQKARQHVMAEFSKSQLQAKTLAVYNELLM